MRNTISALLLTSAITTNAQSLTSQVLKDKYPALFKTFVYQGNIFEWVAAQPENDIFNDLTSKNALYLDYILNNQTSFDRKKIAVFKYDSIQLIEAFRNELRQDTAFNRNMLQLSYWYLKSKHINVADYQSTKTDLTTDQLINIATRFFFATKIQPDNNVGWKVCIGQNAYADDKRNSTYPLIEAFCFMAIMNNIETAQYYQHFEEYGITISQQTKYLPESERLIVARESMYKEMAGNSALKTALLNAYRNKADMLSFRLTDQ
ncbi:hypothetical protein GO495_25735 [Chitinophaga oryziterrae]|uniref:Uncharacterized protein n=1 Tax=Chitinophaga oryziterrae TaxID=1031224 RepID=A0A6N8JFJ2_9BACT|nr:hypothetical protein [Chitinophaga oryziterrae]MVT44023.1 hypothetical protein [Chitinophaga oryziterrae]